MYIYIYIYISIYIFVSRSNGRRMQQGGLRISAGRRRRRQGAQRGRGGAAATVTRTLSPPLRLLHALPAKRPGPDRHGGRDGPDVAAALGHVTDARGGKLASEPRRRQPPNRTARLVGRAQRRLRLAAGSLVPLGRRRAARRGPARGAVPPVSASRATRAAAGKAQARHVAAAGSGGVLVGDSSR